MAGGKPGAGFARPAGLVNPSQVDQLKGDRDHQPSPAQHVTIAPEIPQTP